MLIYIQKDTHYKYNKYKYFISNIRIHRKLLKRYWNLNCNNLIKRIDHVKTKISLSGVKTKSFKIISLNLCKNALRQIKWHKLLEKTFLGWQSIQYMNVSWNYLNPFNILTRVTRIETIPSLCVPLLNQYVPLRTINDSL